MNSRWTAAIIAVLSVFVILIAVGQACFTGGEKITTETAYAYGLDEEVPFDGVYLRDEKLIFGSGTGVLSYECEDGSKVGKSTVVARRCRSDNDIAYRREIEALQRQVEVLSNAEKLIGTDSSQLEAISAQINESHSQIVSCIMDGDYSAAQECQSSLLEALCKREITLKECSGYADKKAAIQQRISELNSMISGEVQDITAGEAGYFISSVDGYESELTFDSAKNMTAERIMEIIANPQKIADNGAVGKLIADYHWRVAAVIPNENLFGVNAGSTVTIRVGSSLQMLDMSVISVTPCGDGKSVYVFESDRLNSAVTAGRIARFKIVVNSYGGLRVPRKALRYNDEDERGVYIVRGQSVAFRKVDVVYWGADYIIVEQNPDDEYLKLYDRVVTDGKELYDGKLIG